MADREGSSEAGRLDPAAVTALYACHADELRAYLAGLLRDPHLAEEVLQTAFARAVELGHTARDGSRKAWLFRVAHNEGMDRKRRAAIEDRSVRKSTWWKGESDTDSDTIGRSETVDRVRQAIDALPAEQRDVVRWRIYEEKTFAEIAALSGVPLGTVLTRMRLATKKLTAALKGELDP